MVGETPPAIKCSRLAATRTGARARPRAPVRVAAKRGWLNPKAKESSSCTRCSPAVSSPPSRPTGKRPRPPTSRTSARSPRTSSAPAKATSRPTARRSSSRPRRRTRGNPFYQIFTMDLATGRTAASAPASARRRAATSAPDGKKIIFASSHLDPDAKKHYADEYQQREEDAQGRQAPPLQLGLRSAHDDLRGQPRRHAT